MLSAYFEQLAAVSGDAKRAANWVCNVLKSEVVTEGLDARFPVTVAQLAGLFARLDDGTISGKLAKDVYQDLVGTARTADEVIEAKGLRVVTDPAAIEAMLRTILTQRDSSPLGVTLLSSDMGKLYVALAQAIERLR